MRLVFTSSLLLLALSLMALSSGADEAVYEGGNINTAVDGPGRTHPHIVFLLSDDAGWNDFSIHGGTQCKTPNIDAAAAESVVLDNYYTHSVCSPTRAAFLTGRHSIHTGAYSIFNGADYLDTKFSLLPQYLKSCCDYATHLVGKVSQSIFDEMNYCFKSLNIWGLLTHIVALGPEQSVRFANS
jgi:Sulfatase